MIKRTEFLPAAVTWESWGKLFLDVPTWQPVVERICQQHGIGPVHHVEAGYPGTCAVFVVNQRVVVKLYPPMLPHDFAKEREAYALLSGRLALLPTLLGSGIYHDRAEWPYLVSQFHPGKPIRAIRAQLTPADVQPIAQALGAAIRYVHQTPMANAQAFDPMRAGWRHFLAQRQAACLDELRESNFLSAPVQREVMAFLADHVPLLQNRVEQPVLLHADLTEDHLLLEQTPVGWRASALIDWADAEVGAPAYEWIPLWFGLCDRNATFFRAILRSYDARRQMDARFYQDLFAYTFLHRFGPGIIEHVWHADGEPAIRTVDELQRWLWHTG